MAKKKGNWEKEDKFLDYVIFHKKEITKYLIVVLIFEIWNFFLKGFILQIEALKSFSMMIAFIGWGLPYFLACKLWVWKQTGDDAFVWAMQGMKFLMSFIVIFILGILLPPLLAEIITNTGLLKVCCLILSEVLYFVAMFKIVLRPQKK